MATNLIPAKVYNSLTAQRQARNQHQNNRQPVYRLCLSMRNRKVSQSMLAEMLLCRRRIGALGVFLFHRATKARRRIRIFFAEIDLSVNKLIKIFRMYCAGEKNIKAISLNAEWKSFFDTNEDTALTQIYCHINQNTFLIYTYRKCWLCRLTRFLLLLALSIISKLYLCAYGC